MVAALIAAIGVGRWLRMHPPHTPPSQASTIPSEFVGKSSPWDRGEVLFQIHCANCHGPDGHGDLDAISRQRPPPRDFAARPWRFEVTADSIRRVTWEGIPGTAMPAHREVLSTHDLELVVRHTYRLATFDPRTAVHRSPLDEALVLAGFHSESPPRPSPQLTLTDASGRTRTLSDERGRLVLLLFWGANCQHCLVDMPRFQSIADRWESQGLTVLSVCADAESAEAAQNLVQSHSPRTRTWIDATGRANALFEVQALPTILLINRDGDIIGRTQGMQDWDSPATSRLLELLLRTSG
jgi:peroxiredoxin